MAEPGINRTATNNEGRTYIEFLTEEAAFRSAAGIGDLTRVQLAVEKWKAGTEGNVNGPDKFHTISKTTDVSVKGD